MPRTALVAAPGFVKLDEPNSDGLFYEVEKLRIEGHGEAEATRMAAVGLAILAVRLVAARYPRVTA